MTIQDVYLRFQTPNNLQEHMLRVASLSKIILNHWKKEILDKLSITQACLLHDIAKPMNFNLSKQAKFGMSAEEIARLATLQEHLRTDYDPNEHKAVVKICKEIGCSSATIRFVDNLEWDYIPRLLDKNDIESLVPIYCDMRIAPHGIMPLIDRLNELKTRDHDANNIDELVKGGQRLEEKLQEYISISLQEITNEQIDLFLNGLREMEIS